MSKHFKFGIVHEETDKQFVYENTWCVQTYPNFERLVVAPKENQIEVILDILKRFDPPYCCLYVLVVSRAGNPLGRYQCPYPMSYDEIYDFAMKYKSYFETDGRHHIWFGSAKTKQLLVYDNHNVIYIYDNIQKTAKCLKKKGFIEKQIKFPKPHTHMYNLENDVFEKDIMNHWDWKVFPIDEKAN